jgi:glucosamine-6-phosphate deaminase
MTLRSYDTTSAVETRALRSSGEDLLYPPRERIGCIVVDDFPSLGRLTALRFIEWLQKNPDGVISLPTGKTPEHFIRWTKRYLRDWDSPDVRKELVEWSLDPARPPRMDGFTFVQIDEFYPMNPAHANSFASYIARYYFGDFGLDPEKAMLMDAWTLGAPAGKDLGDVFGDGPVDLSLRHRTPAGETEAAMARAIIAADQFASDYESRLAALGGIGFFLGGIGPDGHIGFNIRGSDPHGTTRLTPINYETAAAAAGDLGGIEISRRKAVVTIGLATITRNPAATAIIFAAGETKARIVADAVEQPISVLFPATALQALPAARMYLTRGAAMRLFARRRVRLARIRPLPEHEAARIVMDAAVAAGRRLETLTPEHLSGPMGDLIPRAELKDIAARAARSMAAGIALGMEMRQGATFLHTGPHHDDVMLGCMPYIVHQVRSPSSRHFFAVMTSGFTSVTNLYALGQLRNLLTHLDSRALDSLWSEGYFETGNTAGRNRDLFQYLDGVAAVSATMQREGEARRMLRNLSSLLRAGDLAAVRNGADRLAEIIGSAYPGMKDPPEVQTFKGMIREWEEELVWAHLGIPGEQVFHMRLGFYTGDLFTPQPETERDVTPVVHLLDRISPDVLSVALDPEGSGPDTHYKVLQAVAEAVRIHLKTRRGKPLTILGYRNVWHRFHPSEANVYVPLSMNGMAILRSAFHACFGSQRSASFPSHEYDGPFCDLAQRIMVDQYAEIKTCLGREFFYGNPTARLKATRGLNFLKSMEPDEFFQVSAELRKATEQA